MYIYRVHSVSLHLRIHLRVHATWKELAVSSVLNEPCLSFGCNRTDDMIPVIKYATNYT
jgi:hypothetical protein